MAEKSGLATATRETKIAFVMKLGRALHQYGTPAHRLESALMDICESLGIKGQFFSTPTSLMASFEAGTKIKTVMIRVQPGGSELEKMYLINKLVSSFKENSLSISQCEKLVDEIALRPDPWPTWLSIFCSGLISGTSAVLFHAGWSGVFLSFLLGIMVGLLEKKLKPHKNAWSLFELMAALLVSFLATLAWWQSPNFPLQQVTLASLIILLPGLSLTVSMAELATQNLVSGTARLMGALIKLFKLIFGVAIGFQLAKIVTGINAPEFAAEPFSELWQYIAFALAPLGFAVLFNARKEDAPWIWLASVISVMTAKSGSFWLGAEIGAFIGGFAVALFGNFYSRVTGNPTTTIKVPGIIMLVPGSIGFKGFALLAQNETLTGIETAFEMFIVAIALVAGLFFANIALTPKRDF